MFSHEDIERIVALVYDKILDIALIKYGKFEFPKIYVPRLHEEEWKRSFLPEKDSAKFYGVIFYEPNLFAVNTWALLREMDTFGEDYTRDKVCETICHEVAHYRNPTLSEIEINIEGERLLRLVRES